MLRLNTTHHFICGGSLTKNSTTTIDLAYIVSNDQFTKVSSMGLKRRSHGCAQVGHRVFIAGGFNNGEKLDSVEYFSLKSLEWNEGPALPIQTTYAKLIELNDDLYFIGGWENQNIYRLETSTGVALSELKWQKVGHLKSDKITFSAFPWRKRVCKA